MFTSWVLSKMQKAISDRRTISLLRELEIAPSTISGCRAGMCGRRARWYHPLDPLWSADLYAVQALSGSCHQGRLPSDPT